MRSLLASLVMAASMLAACEPPEGAGPVGAAVVEPPPQIEPLTDAVASTVRELREIASSGGYRELARLADETPSFRSNNAGMSHREYWNLKERTGDFPAAHVGQVLRRRHTVADTPEGKVYIWPDLAMLKPQEITPALAREIDGLLGEGQADELRRGGIWPGYVLGIGEDGTWLYFVSGSG